MDKGKRKRNGRIKSRRLREREIARLGLEWYNYPITIQSLVAGVVKNGRLHN